MILLKPISKERIWGTSRLHQYAGDSSIKKIGSVYSLSGNRELSNEIISGSSYKDLYHAIEAEPEKFGLEEGMVYPVIISFTAADEKLSIQVHPTDEYAKGKEGLPTGKSESWYFLEPPTSSWIYANSLLKDKKEIKKEILKGDYEKVVGKEKAQQDDLIFIPSGTLHALTEGALVYEIQQSTDITYRFYDYDRIEEGTGKKRPLHLDSALATLNTESEVEGMVFEKNSWMQQEPYSLLRTKLETDYTNEKRIAQAITVTKGSMTIEGQRINQGMTLLVLPKEQIEIEEAAEEVVIATPKIYWKR